MPLGSAAIFNAGSPSSYADTVAAICREFIDVLPGQRARVLDFGGTGAFESRARTAKQLEVARVNLDPAVRPHFASVQEVPVRPPFDFAMAFGVIEFLNADDLRSVLSDIRARLTAGAALLIAELDPEAGVFGRLNSALTRAASGGKIRYWPAGELRTQLEQAGYSRPRDRPDLRPASLLASLSTYYCVEARA